MSYIGNDLATDQVFLPDGVGAVSRTIPSKLKDTISVKDFGAVGNGVSDDTDAIQAAVTAALSSKASLYVPTGNYKLTSQINVSLYDASAGRGLIIYGDGWGSKFTVNHTGTGFFLDCTPSFQLFQAELKDLHFTDGTVTPDRFVQNNGAVNTLIDGCIFDGATVSTACVVNDNAYGLSIVNTIFTNIVGTGVLYNYTSSFSTYSYVNSIEGCDFSTLTTGIQLQGCNALLVSNTVFQDCTKGFYANPVTTGVSATNITFDTCWFERNTSYDIQLTSSASYGCSATIKNCQFAGSPPTYQAHIDLSLNSHVIIEGTTSGSPVFVSGSSSATATLIATNNFVQSGTFKWTSITEQGDITAQSFTGPVASINAAGNVVGSSFKSSSGVYGSPASGSPVTLTTLPNVADGTWLVTGCLSGTGAVAAYSCAGIISTQGTSSVYSAIKTATNLALSVSGLNFQGTQSSGAVYSISWTITKIG
jgi:hypothetical protein